MIEVVPFTIETVAIETVTRPNGGTTLRAAATSWSHVIAAMTDREHVAAN
jgi:hypothetical protein